MCAGGPLYALDLAGPYAEAARRAERDWDTWNELGRAHPAAHSFAELLQKTGSFGEARQTYADQAPITEFQRIAVDSRLEFGAGFQRDPVVELGRDRADFIARRIAAEAHPTDVLTLDGWWIAAWLGWQAHATAGTSEPTPAPDGWVPPVDGAEFDVLGYLASRPPDTMAVSVLCRT